MNIVSNMAIFSSHREVFGLPVCDLDWSEAFSFVSALSDLPIGQTVISFLNANNANIMWNDPIYRQSLERHLVLPDGFGIDMASFLTYGSTFPANLNGTDFVPSLMTYMTKPKRVGLIGTRRDTLIAATRNFKAHAPWHEFIAIEDGFFPEAETRRVLADIEREKLDILLVAMGTPKQEKWIDAHIRPEHARLAIGVGALFDFVSGEVRRAPPLVRRLRMEWVYRVAQEPRRLAKRYFIGGPVFVVHMLFHAALRATRARVRGVRGPRKRLQQLGDR